VGLGEIMDKKKYTMIYQAHWKDGHIGYTGTRDKDIEVSPGETLLSVLKKEDVNPDFIFRGHIEEATKREWD